MRTESLNDYWYSTKVLLDKTVGWLLIIPEAISVSNEENGKMRLLQLQRANPFTPASYFGISSRWIFWFHWWRLCKSNVWCLTKRRRLLLLCSLTGWAADRMTLRRSCDTVSLAQSTGRMSTTRRWEQDLAARRHLIFSGDLFKQRTWDILVPGLPEFFFFFSKRSLDGV